jgi:hypothetical protein
MVVVKFTKFLWEVYLIRLHHYPGFGFDLLFKVTEVKVETNYEVGVFFYDLT